MSGHSKWNNIRRKKEKTDENRAKVLTKIGRELTVAVKVGGSSNPKNNSKLKDCILKAKINNIPKNNINKILKKAYESKSVSAYEKITYEGYGPGGVAILVECLTDNRNRTAGDVRYYFSKCDGDLGTTGCAAFMFEEKRSVVVEKTNTSGKEKIIEDALKGGAEDIFINKSGNYEVISSAPNLEALLKSLENGGYRIIGTEKKMVPKSFIVLDETRDSDKLIKLSRLIDFLNDDNDVQNVFTNCKNLS